MVTIVATLEGETQLSRKLLAVGENIKSWEIPLQAASDELMKSFQLNFDARGGLFEAGGWAPRSASSTATWPLLEKTGALRGGFTKQVTGDTATLGNSVDYFKYHQSNASRTRLPRRIMMKIDQTRKEMIVKAFQKFVNEVLK